MPGEHPRDLLDRVEVLGPHGVLGAGEMLGEWVSPDSRDLADLAPVYRGVWAQWVLVRLESLDGPVAGRRVHLVAPQAYVGPLAAVLQDAGAEVTVGGDEPRPVPVVAEPRVAVEEAVPVPVVETEAEVEEEPVTPPERRAEQAPLAQAGPMQDGPGDAVLAAVEHLASAEHAVRPQDLDAIQEVAGVFAWHVDAEGTVQLHGRSRSSTFRAALATILQEPLRAHGLDDPVVADWMQQHLRVVTWPMHDREAIRELAQHGVEQLEPPLNVDHLRAGEVRRRLGELRRAVR